MVKICQTGLQKLNFEILPKKRIFRFLPKISAGHGWSWKIFYANLQILGPLGCQGWVVIPQIVKKSQNHCTLTSSSGTSSSGTFSSSTSSSCTSSSGTSRSCISSYGPSTWLHPMQNLPHSPSWLGLLQVQALQSLVVICNVPLNIFTT